MSRPAAPLKLTDQAREGLVRIASSSREPYRRVVQAKALLWASEGVANAEIARRCDTNADTVRRWRARFEAEGVSGVSKVAPGRGRKPGIDQQTVAEVVRTTLHERPDDGSTHWSTRSLADQFGIGKDTIARIWRGRGLKPWLVDTFKLSNDPDFEAKLVDIVGLYMNPPERAVVWSFDEKTQVQALNRTQPSLPMKKGRAGTMTHDYKRNGTTDLFAAMDIATGQVLTHCRQSHNHKDFLFFLKLIDLHVAKGLDIHLVLDNLAVHKTPEVKEWMRKHPRFHFHFTPTSSSWLNLIERWFRELTDKRLRRGSFTTVKELKEAIDLWAAHWNDDPKPFIWHKTAEEIIAKVKRGRAALDHQIKSATDH
jgi:transposase